MENKDQEMEIDVGRVIAAFFKRWWAITLLAIIGASAALGISVHYLTPMYESSSLLYVNNSTSLGGISISSSDLNVSRNLVSTYEVILKSRLTLEAVKKRMDNDLNANNCYTVKEYDEMIKADSVSDTEVMRITVTCRDREDAARIANYCLVVLIGDEIDVGEILEEIDGIDIDSARSIKDIISGTTPTYVDLAIPATVSCSPHYTRNTIIGFAAGFLLACLLIFVFDYLLYDNIESDEWLKKTFDGEIPVLAVVPTVGRKHKGGYYKSYGYGKYGRYGRYGRYGGYGSYGVAPARREAGKNASETDRKENR